MGGGVDKGDLLHSGTVSIFRQLQFLEPQLQKRPVCTGRLSRRRRRPQPGFKVTYYNDISGVRKLTPLIQVDSEVFSRWLALKYANEAPNVQILIWDAFKSQQERL